MSKPTLSCDPSRSLHSTQSVASARRICAGTAKLLRHPRVMNDSDHPLRVLADRIAQQVHIPNPESEVAEGALQFQGFGGEGAGRHAEKLELGKQSTLRSTATEDGKAEIPRRRAQRSAAPSCPPHLRGPCTAIHQDLRRLRKSLVHPARRLFAIGYFLSSVAALPRWALAPGFRLPLSPLRFQLSAFCFLLRGQSSNVRWVCYWREVSANAV